jgi:anti-anti-sigma factor
MDMAIIVQDVSRECTIVQICGELDISTAPDLRERLLAILNRRAPSRLVLDLSKLEFMDSSGVAVLVSTERRTRLLGSTVVLVDPQRPVWRVLQVCGLDRYFLLFADVAAAIEGPADLPRPLRTAALSDAGGLTAQLPDPRADPFGVRRPGLKRRLAPARTTGRPGQRKA